MPCDRAWAIRMRQAGSTGWKRIAVVRFGGIATIALRALMRVP